MGLEWITKTVEALQQAGIRAQRGYCAEKMPSLDSPVVSVTVAQLQPDATVLAVQVFSSAAQGGLACENMALLAAESLLTIGGVCRVGACSFDGKTGLFSVVVQVSFTRPAAFDRCQVLMNGVALPYAVGFKASYSNDVTRTFDTDNGEPIFLYAKDGWRLTIEEMLPADMPPEQENMDTFSLQYNRIGGKEFYRYCCWESIVLEPTPSGIRRVRIAISGRPPEITLE